MSEERILIAGGGIGGLATANAFAKAGHEVVVFEQAEELREIGAAIGVQTNAMKALRSFGREDAVHACGVRLEHYEYFSWRGKRLVSWPQGDIGRKLGADNVVVHRADLQKALLEGLDPSVVRLGTRIAGYEEAPDGVTVRLEDGTEERGALLVGADGINSVVRKQMLGETGKRYAGWVAVRGIATFESPLFPLHYARQFIGRGRSFGMWHIPNGRIYWVATLKVDENATDGSKGRKQLILDEFGSAPAPTRALVEATDESVILRNPIYDRAPVENWSTNRVTLLGDAAHATTPVTGQGGGQAIEDAAVMAKKFEAVDKLSDTDAVAAALRAYQAERAPRTAAIIEEAWFISKMHHWSNPVVTWLRDVGMKTQPQKVWVKRMEERLGTYQY